MGIGFPGIIVLYKEGVTVISCGRLKPVVLNEPTNSRMVGKPEVTRFHPSRGLLATNLPLFPRRLQLVTLHQTPRIFE